MINLDLGARAQGSCIWVCKEDVQIQPYLYFDSFPQSLNTFYLIGEHLVTTPSPTFNHERTKKKKIVLKLLLNKCKNKITEIIDLYATAAYSNLYVHIQYNFFIKNFFCLHFWFYVQLEAGKVKLQSRLEEEEQAKAALMGRIQRLTKLILVSTKSSIQPNVRDKPGHRRRHSFGEDEVTMNYLFGYSDLWFNSQQNDYKWFLRF